MSGKWPAQVTTVSFIFRENKQDKTSLSGARTDDWKSVENMQWTKEKYITRMKRGALGQDRRKRVRDQEWTRKNRSRKELYSTTDTRSGLGLNSGHQVIIEGGQVQDHTTLGS